jgi:hypothetical protein
MPESTQKPLPLARGRKGSGSVSIGKNVVDRYRSTSSNLESRQVQPTRSNKVDNSSIQSENVQQSKVPDNISKITKINEKSNKVLLDLFKLLKSIAKSITVSERKTSKKKEKSSTLERLMERINKYSPSNLLERGKEKAISLTSKGLDKLGVKNLLDKWDAKDKLAKPKKTTVTNKKSNPVHVKIIREKDALEKLVGTKQKSKQQVESMANDKSTIVKVIKTIGSSVGAIVGVLLKVLLAVLIIAAAAGLGYMLYKLLIEPWLNKSEKRAQERLAKPETVGKNATTATGQEIYEKTVKTPEGPKTVYVTKEQMQKEIAELPEEQREEAATQYVPARQVTDISTGKTMMTGGAGTVTGEMSIEELNQKAKEQQQRSPRLKALENYNEELNKFQADFKDRMERLITEIGEMGGIEGSTQQVAAASTISPELQSLFEMHTGVMDRIKNDKNLTNEDKKMLLDSYPITRGGMEAAPDYDSAVRYNYTLPNQQTIELMPLSSNRALTGFAKAANWLNPISGPIVGKMVDAKQQGDKLNAQQQLNEALSTGNSSDLNNRIQAIRDQETQKIQTTPPAPETSGSALQQQTLDIKAPQQTTTPTNNAGTTVVNNINAAPKPSGGSISMGGGSSANYTGAIQPDSDSTYAYLVQDMSVPVIAGGNSI